jgi:hypothetical protein
MRAMVSVTRRDALLVGALTLLVFSPTLGNDWVEWDDRYNFAENPYYRGLGWRHIVWMFTAAQMGHWTPLTWVTLGLDYVVWGMNPIGYHLTNLLWHAAGAALVSMLAARLLARVWPDVPTLTLRLGAGTAALFFAVHPLRVESVAWISERRDVVSGVFYLLTVLAWLWMVERPEGERRRWRIVALAAYALALLSKSIVISLPLVLLVLDVYPLRRLTAANWRSPEGRRVVLEKVPFALMALALTAVTLVTFHSTRTSLQDYPPTARLGLVCYSLVFYVWKTLLPTSLSPIYELPWTVRLTDAPFLFATVLVAATLLAILLARRRWPAGLAVAVAYAVTLAPVSGVAQTGPQLVADRYSYLSTLGLALLLGGGVIALLSGALGDLRLSLVRVGTGAVAVWIVGLAVLTVIQVRVWRNDRTLWEHALAINPECAYCNNGYGAYQAASGEAESRLRLALDANAADLEARTQLAAILFHQMRYPEAEAQLRIALRQAPRAPEVLALLGVVLLESGRAPEAVPLLEAAVDLAPTSALAHFGLGRVLQVTGREAEVARHLAALERLEPRLAERLKRGWYRQSGAAQR